MKSNINKNNHLLQKLLRKPLPNKKEGNKNNDCYYYKENNKNVLENLMFSDKNILKYELNRKCITLRESYRNKINNKELNKSNENNNCINNKRNILLINKNNTTNNTINNKLIINNNKINSSRNSNSNKNIFKTKNINNFGLNKTINYIRTQNPKINSVLNNNNKIKSKGNKYILNYNNLNKNYSLKTSLNNSMNKRKSNKEEKNKSFRASHNFNKYFDADKLKRKLKENKSIEKGYITFYKVDKKNFNSTLGNNKKINKTIIQNYLCPFNNKEEFDYDKEKSSINRTFYDEIYTNKENEINKDEIRKKDIKNLYLELSKLKIHNIQNDNNIISKTERHTNPKEKSKTSSIKNSSNSVQKRKNHLYSKNKKEYLTKKIKKGNFIRINKNICYNSKYASKNAEFNKSSINFINKIKEKNKIKNESNNSKNMNKSEIFEGSINKRNDEIFEIISNVKVKSFVEYVKDKNKSQKTKNDIDIKTNEINNIQNEKPKKNSNNDMKFIEDRDEYNIILKETFSKDRFSFRPTNKDSNGTFQDTRLKKDNNELNKNDFLTNNIIASPNLYFINNSLNSSKNYISNNSNKNNDKFKNIGKMKSKKLKKYKK